MNAISNFILVGAICGFAAPALACENGNEAQFKATVASSTKTDLPGICRITFSAIQTWNENAMCPLDVEDTQSKPVLASCKLAVGAQVSGVMVDNATGFLSWQ